MLPRFTYSRPRSLEQAVSLAARPGTRVHAGGTDLLGCLRDGVFGTESLVSLSGLRDLRGVTPMAGGGLRIGALTTIAEVAAHQTVRDRYPALSQAAVSVASPQLRNQGTIGGNLCQKPRCWYYRGDFHCLRKGGDTCFAYEGENQYHCILGGEGCYIVHPSDTAPALAALGARVTAVSGGRRRSIAVEELHVPPSEDPRRETVLEPGEIVSEVILPAPAAGLRSSYRKIRERASWDFALAGVALALAFEDRTVVTAAIFLSGAAPVPWRARSAEQVVKGSRLDAATVEQAAHAAVADAEPLAQNGYKVPLFVGLLREQLTALGEGG